MEDGVEGGCIRVDAEREREESRSQHDRGSQRMRFFFTRSNNFKSFWGHAFTHFYS